jgi:hypothetical protein
MKDYEKLQLHYCAILSPAFRETGCNVPEKPAAFIFNVKQVSVMKTQAVCSIETASFFQTTRCNIPAGTKILNLKL